ncbi:unnamed protein product [Rotaria magnacalcarata]|uniref:Uncharacterized protein n=1 Tax=Rotaria magnacalcarata TaxID=392030 RepID=A0A814JAJ1_9BILA|nr:unnamed protein product [Rotaria magnacalcarata]CAF1652165.1 unnamed protein product [Rotaria magnacalcarata]CAF3992269.1 unnamed protein product [Rotaria magnacalcarata]CAF4099802.1 unnamed protein product [Rotaria magnacalcarata]
MMKHFGSWEKNSINNNNESLINEYFSSRKTRSVPTRIKKKVLNATVELVGGNGFINLAQTVFDAGQELSKSENTNVSDLLPHPTAVSVSFCGISLHFLNEELQLYAFILGCYPYDRDNQSSSQLQQFVDAKLLEFDLSVENSKFVATDNENKMKSCFKDPCIRIGCSIHYLSKQLEHCFTSVTLEKIPQSKSPRTFQSYPDNRFNGAFPTMNVFLTLSNDLAGVLDRTFLDDYMLMDKDLLEHVRSFLGPFEELINELSCDKKPTVYKVLPLRQCLINRCTIHQNDHDGIRQMKTFLSNTIIEKLLRQTVLPYGLSLNSELLMYIQRLLIQQEAERRAQQSIEIDIDEDNFNDQQSFTRKILFLLSSSIVIKYFLSVGANLDFDMFAFLI